MSQDDEIAVVLYKNEYYVYRVGGGNYEYAIIEGTKFKTLESALKYAESIDDTEYGVTEYDPFEYEINEHLEKYSQEHPKMVKFWSDDLKLSNDRKSMLVNELKKHNLLLRSDSKLCKLYINGNQENLEHVILTMVEMDFLFKHAKYQRFRFCENPKLEAWNYFKATKRDDLVPDILKHYLTK